MCTAEWYVTTTKFRFKSRDKLTCFWRVDILFSASILASSTDWRRSLTSDSSLSAERLARCAALSASCRSSTWWEELLLDLLREGKTGSRLLGGNYISSSSFQQIFRNLNRKNSLDWLKVTSKPDIGMRSKQRDIPEPWGCWAVLCWQKKIVGPQVDSELLCREL